MEEFENPCYEASINRPARPNQMIQTFYDIPNHFPQLTKGGLSQWLPRQFKNISAKNYQLPLYTPGSSMIQSTNNSFESPGRKLTLSKIPVTANEALNYSVKIKENLKHKVKMINLCDELEFTVRKIPSFQVKGVPTPTHNRYEMMKTVSPFRVNIDFTEKISKPLNKINKIKRFKIPAVEIAEKDKIKNKEWIFSYFLESLRSSNGLSPPQSDTKTYKFFVGPGNNSGLVVRILRSRPWWVQTDNRKEANLIWTSLKHSKTLKRLDSGRSIQAQKAATCPLPRQKQIESKKFGFDLILESNLMQKLETSPYLSSNLKLCNKLEENEQIASKKLLFSNMKAFYSQINKNIFQVVPVTFHVKSINDPDFLEFENYFKSASESNNIWIVKPGENTNRGKGISVAASLSEIRALVKEKSSSHTCIIQKYIERPLLINKRKFDIRCFALLTSINSVLQGYFYTEGYIRTSCKEFSLKNLENKYIHLTNDAVQKHSEDYGKFEPANKLSYSEFQNYVNQSNPKLTFNFEKDILMKIKEIVQNSFYSVAEKIDPHKRLHCFELFGFDFMVDEDFHVWLIEVNTNPCLETSCAFLSRIIPACVDNTFRISLDPLFPPPPDNRKNLNWVEEVNIVNKFELVYNQLIESK